MNLFENLLLYRELADGRADIKSQLRNSEKQRRENLMQLFIWRDSTTVNHWCNELYAICHEINRLKNNKKYPKEKFILQEIWGCWEDCYHDRINNYIKDLERKEGQKVPDFSKDNLYDFMKEYHEWLANKLSDKGFINISDVKDKIKHLFNKYSLK